MDLAMGALVQSVSGGCYRGRSHHRATGPSRLGRFCDIEGPNCDNRAGLAAFGVA